MRLDYRKMQKEILPGKETQDWMWEEIERIAAKGEKKQNKWVGLKMAASIAAAVIVFVALIPQTSWADQITGLVKEFFYANANIKQDIVPNVYEDEGKYGHVRMKIQEMISDGACTYGTICYEALDAEGEQWLKEQEFDVNSIRFTSNAADDDYNSSITVVADDGNKTVIGGWNLHEQKELAAEKARYFAFSFENDSGSFPLKNETMTMFYPMYRSQGIGKVKVCSALDTVSYRLVGDKSPSEYYEPEYLVVSKLSYALFGKDYGTHKYWFEEGMWCLGYSEGFLAEKGDNEDFVYRDGIPMAFKMKDGSTLEMGYAWSQLYEAENTVSGSDFLISAGHFNVDSENWERIMPIDDPNELTGIEIDGVHYDLVKEEIADK